MVALRAQPRLVDDLERLAASLETTHLAIHSSHDEGREATRDRLIRTIRSFLIPKLTHPHRPLSVVIAGPTGAGKSTLLNSLSGLDISETGPIRPTTDVPVVLCADRVRDEFTEVGGVYSVVVTGEAPILKSLALIDTPDIDSTETEHRVIAERLIDTADIVVFVTSAMRYADLVPWEVLRRAESRGAPVVNVINRVTSSSAGAVGDFTGRLIGAGFTGDLIRVPEHHIGAGAHRVPALAVRELQRRLVELAGEHRSRDRDIFNRVLASTLDEARALADQADLVERARAIAAAELIETLEDRGRALDLSSLADAADVGEPPKGRWRRRRWSRANRVDPGRLERFASGMRRRLSSTVESDIGRAITELTGGTTAVSDVVSGLDRLIDNAVAGWLEEIGRMTGAARQRDRGLSAIVLVSAAMGSPSLHAAGVLFGIDGDVLIGEARRHLRSRLEVVYAQAGAALVDFLQLSDLDTEPGGDALRQRLTGVVARSHFADA